VTLLGYFWVSHGSLSLLALYRGRLRYNFRYNFRFRLNLGYTLLYTAKDECKAKALSWHWFAISDTIL